MKNNTFFLNIFFLMCLGLSCILACCKKDKCEGVKCYNGNECLDGKCGCPPNSIRLTDRCLTIEENSYVCTDRCRCIDTFLLTLGKYSTGDSTMREVIINFKKDGSASTIGEYYKTKTGDSLFAFLSAFPSKSDPFSCNLKGILSVPVIAARVIPGKEIRGKLYWWNEAFSYIHPMDSCNIVLHK